MRLAPPPTSRQQDMLRAIAQLQDRHGTAPSVRDLGDHLGIRNPSTVHYMLDRLAERGWLQRTPGIARGLVLLRRLPEPGREGDVVTLPVQEYDELLAHARAWQAHLAQAAEAAAPARRSRAA